MLMFDASLLFHAADMPFPVACLQKYFQKGAIGRDWIAWLDARLEEDTEAMFGTIRSGDAQRLLRAAAERLSR